jgi:hypothetical protein
MKSTILKGSTLIETIVAMILILLCFGIFIIIYNNVLSSKNNRIHLSATLLLDDLAIMAHKNNNWIDENVDKEKIKIKKVISAYKDCPSLRTFELKAFDERNQLIVSRKEIIKIR